MVGGPEVEVVAFQAFDLVLILTLHHALKDASENQYASKIAKEAAQQQGLSLVASSEDYA